MLIYHTKPENQGYIKNQVKKKKRNCEESVIFFFEALRMLEKSRDVKGKTKNLEPEDPNFPSILNLAQPLAHHADDSLHFLELKSFLLQNLLKKDVSVN